MFSGKRARGARAASTFSLFAMRPRKASNGAVAGAARLTAGNHEWAVMERAAAAARQNLLQPRDLAAFPPLSLRCSERRFATLR